MKIAIVGLRKGQDGCVRKSCGDLADLRFIDADRSDRSLPDADKIIIFTKFTKHNWNHAAFRKLPRGAVYLYHGGTSKLIDLIKEIVSESRRVQQWRT